MATLDKRVIEGPWLKPFEEWTNQTWAECSAAFEKLCEEATVVRLPRGDGYAYYVVTRRKPLRLAHVPYGDALEADPVLIRGLRWSDLMPADFMKPELFGKKRWDNERTG